jgi:hypothetical protein
VESVLKFRGLILNQALTCPVCGGETMRVKRPRLIRALLGLLHLNYRLCRHCLRTWITWR